MMIVHNINTIYQENKMLACLINIKIIIFNTLVLVMPLESWITSKSELPREENMQNMPEVGLPLS